MKSNQIVNSKSGYKVDSYESALCNLIGAGVSISLIMFFLAMKFFDLSQVLSLRYLNFFFLAGGIITAFYYYKKKYSPSGIDYLSGLKMGMRISLTAVIPFAIFIGIYLKIDSDFMNYIINFAEFGEYLTPGNAAAAIGFEGVVSGALVTYMSMQYFKKNSD